MATTKTAEITDFRVHHPSRSDNPDAVENQQGKSVKSNLWTLKDYNWHSSQLDALSLDFSGNNDSTFVVRSSVSS